MGQEHEGFESRIGDIAHTRGRIGDLEKREAGTRSCPIQPLGQPPTATSSIGVDRGSAVARVLDPSVRKNAWK